MRPDQGDTFGSAVGLTLPIDELRKRSSSIKSRFDKAQAYAESADLLREYRIPPDSEFRPTLDVLRDEALQRREDIPEPMWRRYKAEVDRFKAAAKTYFISTWAQCRTAASSAGTASNPG
ncbi:hypothetical protein PUNSTDRAFT_42722 [Punctularia strigosozonata HHB-11173 SS5]|uniref:uncharacterized protein n=1 Tax=Punctularia strigosozonata (strain HHB-11173) TaxID=741275 RepID=UPI0004417D1D|nr:uncharacterized protein PUNSTDRAFT_42722 [Punctularia strigosozonata HHB-11173 SS5]EIN11468.1 hypothetical protein PUNSTDRAFT_42722 [Punctularia strigosozonata HHB-11173 SS5]